jgi:tripartite-type tricarboxylate transporter receptor subunit TctC
MKPTHIARPASRVFRALLVLTFVTLVSEALAQDTAPRAVQDTAPRVAPDAPRPYRLITPFAPRTAPDVVARLHAEFLSTQFKAPVAVENRGGRQAQAAVTALKQSEADGQTLLYSNSTLTAVIPALGNRFGDPFEEMRIVGFTASQESVLVTGTASGIKTLRDLIDMSKKPGSSLSHVVYGGYGAADLAVAALLQSVGGNSFASNYRTPTEAIKDLLEDGVAFGAENIASAGGLIRSGKLIGLAWIGRSRHPQLPAVPTIAEAGSPELLSMGDWQSWFAIFVRKDTPDTTVDQIGRALRASLGNPELVKRFQDMGLEPHGAALSPREAQAEWERRHAQWKTVLPKLGVKAPPG